MKNNNRTNCIIKTDRMGEMLQENFPKASVLIPAYNVEKFLKRSLDSVIAQTYKDFEIILIDDGSVDSTPQICDEYAEKLGGVIKAFHQKNMGLARTRERLLEKANGKYIFWLDADDYWECTLLEKAVKVFEKTDADVVGWGYVRLSHTGDLRQNSFVDLGVDVICSLSSRQ